MGRKESKEKGNWVAIKFFLPISERQWAIEQMGRLWARNYRNLFIGKFRRLLELVEKKHPELIEELKKEG
jgi:hypothetical protein